MMREKKKQIERKARAWDAFMDGIEAISAADVSSDVPAHQHLDRYISAWIKLRDENEQLRRLLKEASKGKSMNEINFEHTSQHGTRFECDRCDLRSPVRVYHTPGDRALFASDVAQMIGFHATSILPTLNGFSGYDTIQWNFEG